MRYVSTRGRAPVLDFEQAMMTGLARDGGLYLPETIPTFSAEEIASLEGLPYEEVARRVITPFVGDSFSDADLRDAIPAITAQAISRHDGVSSRQVVVRLIVTFVGDSFCGGVSCDGVVCCYQTLDVNAHAVLVDQTPVLCVMQSLPGPTSAFMR